VIALLAAFDALAAIPVVAGEPYLLDMAVVTRARVPFAGEREVVTRSLAAVRFEVVDGRWMQHQRPCAVDVEGGNVVFPPAFVQAMPDRSDPVIWTDDGGYRFDPGPAWVGLTPGSELPDKADDPGVIDHEGDGHPGATVLLQLPVFGSVRLYLAQISHGVLVGVADGDGISGRVDVKRLEQRTLGASVGVFAVSPDVVLVPERSRFTLRPDLDGRCAAVWRNRVDVSAAGDYP
jgi:hypothetical protein